MQNERRKEQFRFAFDAFNALASVLAISNFLYAFFSPLTTPTIIPSFPLPLVGLQITLFVLVEGVLAHVFGHALLFFGRKGEGLPFIFIIAITIVSSWTSIFNAQWIILMGPPSGAGDWIVFVICCVIACAFAVYFIIFHYHKNEVVAYENGNIISALQVFIFASMFLVNALYTL